MESEPVKMRIGLWLVDAPMNRLIGDERIVPLEPRAMKTLLYLYENRGRPVSRDELLEKVWEKKALTDHAISVVITSLRQALEDDARSPRYLKTIRKKGYCLVADVAQVEGVSSPCSKPKRQFTLNQFLAVAAILVLGLMGAIAQFWADSDVGEAQRLTMVLDPIQIDVGSEVDLADVSVANDLLLMELSRYGDVTFASSDSSNSDNAVFTLSASVERQNGSLKVSLNSRSYGQTQDTFSELANGNVAGLAKAIRSLVASALAGQRVIAPQTTVRSDVDIILDRARYFWGFHRNDRNQLAYRMVKQLMNEYPANGDVHALLAEMYAALPGSFWGLEGVNTLELAEEHIQRAVELGAHAKYVWRTRARIIQERDQDFVQAAEFYQRAVTHDPEDYWNWRSVAVSHAINERFDEALAAHDKAIALSLEPTGALSEKMITLYFAGQFQEAAKLNRELKGLDGRPGVRSALIYYMAGDHKAAFEEWRQYYAGMKILEVSRMFNSVPTGDVSRIYRDVAAHLSDIEPEHISPLLVAYMWLAAGDIETGTRIILQEIEKHEAQKSAPDYDLRQGRSFMFMRIDPFVKKFEYEAVVMELLTKLRVLNA